MVDASHSQARPGRGVARRAPPARSTRVALVAIAASTATLLAVGGLVLIKGPPTAQARAGTPVAPAARPAPAPAPARTDTPPVGVKDPPDELVDVEAGDVPPAEDDF